MVSCCGSGPRVGWGESWHTEEPKGYNCIPLSVVQIRHYTSTVYSPRRRWRPGHREEPGGRWGAGGAGHLGKEWRRRAPKDISLAGAGRLLIGRADGEGVGVRTWESRSWSRSRSRELLIAIVEVSSQGSVWWRTFRPLGRYGGTYRW